MIGISRSRNTPCGVKCIHRCRFARSCSDSPTVRSTAVAIAAPPPLSPVCRRCAPICTSVSAARGHPQGPYAGPAMRLSHQRRGSGPPLVLIHGIGSQWQGWMAGVESLARGGEGIALDLPGFGESLPFLGQAPSVPDLARAVARFVAELGIERPHVAGNSLGGAVALELGRMGTARSVCALSPAGFAKGWEVPYAITSLRIARALARLLGPTAGVLARSARLRRVFSAQMIGYPEIVPPAEYARA